MNAEQRAALRKVAEEATPGPWNTYLNTIDNVIVRKMHETGYEQCVISYKSHYKNATYIAAANPQAIRELLDYIETLEKDAARWRYARQFLAFEDIEAWNTPKWKGHQPNESENIRTDEAIDAAMQGETNENSFTDEEIFKCLPAEESNMEFARAIEAAILKKLAEQDVNLEQLAASQAREQQLRAYLEVITGKRMSADNCLGNVEIAELAIALPQDTSALEAMIAKAGEVMRERCAVECETHYNFSNALAAAIRALPAVTIDDLK